MSSRLCTVLLLVVPLACDDTTPSASSAPSVTASVRVEEPPPSARPSPAAPLPVASGPEPSFPKPPPLEEVEGAPKKVTFAFSPPVDTPITVEAVRKKQRARGRTVGLRETVRTVKKVSVSKDGEGFRWSVEPVSFSVHGQRTSRVDELVESFPFSYRLDAEGHALGVEGFDDLAAKGKSMLGPMAQRKAGTMLNPETVRRSRIQEWRGRVGDLAGKTFTLDEPIVGKSQITLGKGEIDTYSVITVGPWTKCALGTCVRVTTDADSDPKALAARTGVEVEPQAPEEDGDHDHEGHDHGHEGHAHGPMGQDPATRPKAPAPQVGLRYRVVRIVDPATGMPVWERSDREVDIRAMGKLSDEVVIAYAYPASAAESGASEE